MLFRYDPCAGREGEVTELALMCAPEHREGDPFKIPARSTSVQTIAPGLIGEDL